MIWTTTGTREVYTNPWLRVREDAVVRPDGRPGIYGVVEVRSPAVFVVPVTGDDEVVLVAVERYTTGRLSWEVPAGGTDGEDPLAAARRELREETGLEADDWQQLGAVDSLNGVAAAPGTVFVARRLRETGGAETEAEGITARRSVTFAELAAMITRGEITDNETLGALMLAVVALGRIST